MPLRFFAPPAPSHARFDSPSPASRGDRQTALSRRATSVPMPGHSARTLRRLAHRSVQLALLGGALVVSLVVPERARAEATVVVELKRPDGSPAEGSVQLSKGDSKHSCSTDKAGRCELRGVAGGMYTVSVEQPGRAAPKEKTVVIPPSGEVKLIVNAS